MLYIRLPMMSKLRKLDADDIIIVKQLQLELESVFSENRYQIYNVIDCYLEQFKNDIIYWVYLVYIKLLVKSTEQSHAIDFSNNNIFIPPEGQGIPYSNEQELTFRMWLPDYINSWIIHEKLNQFRKREVYNIKMSAELLGYLPNKLSNFARSKQIKIRKTTTGDVCCIDAKFILISWPTKYLENHVPAHFGKEIVYQEDVKLCVEIDINTPTPNIGEPNDIKYTYFDQVDEFTRVSVERCKKGYVFVIEIEKESLSKKYARLYISNAIKKYLPDKFALDALDLEYKQNGR